MSDPSPTPSPAQTAFQNRLNRHDMVIRAGEGRGSLRNQWPGRRWKNGLSFRLLEVGGQNEGQGQNEESQVHIQDDDEECDVDGRRYILPPLLLVQTN